MSPSDLVQKAVFGRSGNLCAFPKCSELLVVQDSGRTAITGELAHIVARSVQGPRGHLDVDPDDREAPENYVALCRKHHKIVDDNPLRYSVSVLRAMKAVREKAQSAVDPTLPPRCSTNETLHSSMLWVKALPSAVFSAPTAKDFRSIVAGMHPSSEATPIWLSNGRLWTFHDLRSDDGPFADVIERGSVELLSASELWANPDLHRLYVNLLNRALTHHLSRKGMFFDKEHRRYYFTAPIPAAPVERTYTAKAGGKRKRLVVRQGKFKDGTLKEEWWHLAVRLRFEQVSAKSWYMTIRPEYHLTKDGNEPLESHRIGRRITRRKSTVYNEAYLNLVHFWRSVLSDEQPRTVINAGQPVVIESHLVDTSIEWPGIPGDEVRFTPDPYPDNLFTIAELTQLTDPTDDDELVEVWDDDEVE